MFFNEVSRAMKKPGCKPGDGNSSSIYPQHTIHATPKDKNSWKTHPTQQSLSAKGNYYYDGRQPITMGKNSMSFYLINLILPLNNLIS